MKQAMIVIEEIKRLENACMNTKSEYLMRDYKKNIKKLERELRMYCNFKKMDYKELRG